MSLISALYKGDTFPEMSAPTNLAQATITPCALVWRRILDNGSMEFANAAPWGGGFELTGTIVAVHEREPLEVKYRLQCGPDWSTRAVSIEQRRGFQRSALSLAVDDAGAWSDSRGKLDSLTGCLDVDLELSPITNSLPINRLNLGVGQVEEIAVVWVRFPTLEIVHARQSYERLSDRTYRYRSLGSGFTADIDVDESGLTIRYEGIWERVAKAEATT